MAKTVVLVGATGLIGNALLHELIQETKVSEIRIFVRRKLEGLPDKVKQIITDFQDLTLIKEQVTGDVIYCCVGTTRKKTPDLTDYRNIDFGINIGMSKLAKENGMSTVHLISAMGASTRARIFYSKLKGEIEEALKALQFPNCYIYQPSMLIGTRSESRPLEFVAQKLMLLFEGLRLLPKNEYHSIHVKTIAKSMIKTLGKEVEGLHIQRYQEMIR
jgi:nucleoside-diphosphate-sugar epimerase